MAGGKWILHISRTVYSEDNDFPRRCCMPRWIIIWAFPMFIAACGFMVQNFQLHYTTYFYVHQMKQFELQRKPVRISGHDATEPIPLSIGLTPKNVSFGSNEDPISAMLGYEEVPIHFLDILAAAIPAIFVLVSILLDNWYTFSRAMFCFAFMEVLKGLVDWITVMPDSNGWAVCEARLRSSTAGYTVEWYAQEHSFMDLLISELRAPTGRFCSDMMLSGHTQAVTVFGLALFETVTLVTNGFGMKPRRRYVCQTVVAAVVIFQQVAEIFFVLKSRFHYSSDILMALVVSYLVYTSTAAAWLATKWEMQGRDRMVGKKGVELIEKMAEEIPDNAYFGNGKGVKEALSKNAKKFKNPWLNMFEPKLIQLGCCCSASSQLYIINHIDLIKMFETVAKSREAMTDVLKHAERLESVGIDVTTIKEAHEKFEMDGLVEKSFLMMYSLPAELAKDSLPSPPSQNILKEPLLP